MSKTKEIGTKLSIAIIPFIFLLSIGLIEGDITLHQKVFKTLLLFVFNLALIIIFAINIFGEKNELEKKRKYLFYFIAYFVFILIQYIVTFFSGEISYDREYYLADYTFLIMFGLFFFIYLRNLEDVKIGVILLNFFLVIVLVWSLVEFISLRNELITKASSSGQPFSWATFFAQFRPKLSFGNTDYFSGYLIGVLPLALLSPFIFFDDSKKFKENTLSIVFGIIALSGFLPLFFSQTRAAWLGMFVSLVFIIIPSLILIQEKLSKLKKIIFISVFVGFLILVPLLLLFTPNPVSKNLFPRIMATIANPTFYISDRLNGWSGGLGLFTHHPVFGAGIGTVYPASFKYMSKYYYIYSDSNSFKHAHCEFVEVLGEGGLFGFIFFFFLFGFIIFMMAKRTYSKKYSFVYRLLCLGVFSGIISMLIHQIFSLSLRMSVTKTAYFFLLGLGIFLISQTKKALIEPPVDNIQKKSIFPKFFESNISIREAYGMVVVLSVLVFTSFVLFFSVFSCEMNIRNALPLGSKTQQETELYLNKAVKSMPGNPYAWTQKYIYDFEIKLYSLMREMGSSNDKQIFNMIESTYNDVINDLNKLNNIIPGYQDVWSKFSNLYLTRYQYYVQKWQAFNNLEDIRQANDSMNIALEYLNKSINMNFLNQYNHLYKMQILSQLNNKEQFDETVKDYFMVRIYVDFARGKKIYKEQITINYTNDETTTAEFKDNKYVFNVSLQDAKRISDKIFIIKDFDEFQKVISAEFHNLLNPYYQKFKG
ncbi:MAG TPA: O-antigen ligase family protein [Spirochaetota bacterium]|nr:O-antigen ligase family protein [Spirochaetota bacterium]